MLSLILTLSSTVSKCNLRVCEAVTYGVENGRTSAAGPVGRTLSLPGTAVIEAPSTPQRVQRCHTRLAVRVDLARLDGNLGHLTTGTSTYVQQC